MRLLIDAAITRAILFYGSQIAYQAVYYVEVAALKKVAQGLSPMGFFAQQLTGKKFDENFNLVPLEEKESK